VVNEVVFLPLSGRQMTEHVFHYAY